MTITSSCTCAWTIVDVGRDSADCVRVLAWRVMKMMGSWTTVLVVAQGHQSTERMIESFWLAVSIWLSALVSEEQTSRQYPWVSGRIFDNIVIIEIHRGASSSVEPLKFFRTVVHAIRSTRFRLLYSGVEHCCHILRSPSAVVTALVQSRCSLVQHVSIGIVEPWIIFEKLFGACVDILSS